MTNKRTLTDWIVATRPWSYPASTMPVALVLAYYFANGVAIDPVNAVWALLNIIIFHAAGNVWSDYFDFRYGVDNQNTLGVRQLVDGKFTGREFIWFAIFLFVVGTLCALFLVWRTGMPFLAVTFAGIVAALVYPPLKYRVGGDVVIFIAYTLTPLFATAWIVTGTWSLDAIWAVLPTGILTVGILHANNLRDAQTDTQAGIRTLASVLGKKWSVWLYHFEMLAPFAILLATVWLGILPMTVLLTLPIAVAVMTLCQQALRFDGVNTASIATLDASTAKTQLMFSLLMVLGLVAGHWLA
jgi:1,4-dihydroxy-2-naphthoate octaprenyltransferase